MSNINIQPDKIFRKPLSHQLPPGNWTVLPSSTDHSASAFLLHSGNERTLLTSDRLARYQSMGDPLTLVEDGPMNRFEIGTKEDGSSYMCSALSSESHISLLPSEHNLLSSHGMKEGGIRFFWAAPPDKGMSDRVMSSGAVSAKNILEHSEEFLLQSRAINVTELVSIPPQSKFLAEWRGDAFTSLCLVEINGGIVPRAYVQTVSDINYPTSITKSTFLSYKPMIGAQPLAVWYHGGGTRALVTTGSQLLYLEESKERGGEGLSRVLIDGWKDLRLEVSPDRSLYLAWSESAGTSRISFARFPADDILGAEIEITEAEVAGELQTMEIAFDDNDRAFLVYGSVEEEFSIVRQISWSSGKTQTLLDDISVKQVAVSRDSGKNIRGMCFLTDKEAYLLLPINPSLPEEGSSSIKSMSADNNEGGIYRGPGR